MAAELIVVQLGMENKAREPAESPNGVKMKRNGVRAKDRESAEAGRSEHTDTAIRRTKVRKAKNEDNKSGHKCDRNSITQDDLKITINGLIQFSELLN